MHQFFEFVKNHWLLWAALVVVIILLVIEELRQRAQGGMRLTPQTLTQKLNRDEAVVIDIRDKAAYDSGHILSAIPIPQSELETNINKLEKYKNKMIVLVCKDGRNSSAILAKLHRQGFNVCTLAGGMEGWRAAGFPLSKI